MSKVSKIHCTDFNALNAMYVSKVSKIHCTDFNALNAMYVSKVSKIHCTDFNALNAMYVGDVGDGVCGFYATLYTEYRLMSKMSKILCIQWPLSPPGGKAHCSRPSCGFSGSPPCSPRRQLCI